MRVMVFVKATEDSEKGLMPTSEAFEAMGQFNEELIMRTWSKHRIFIMVIRFYLVNISSVDFSQ